jgi:hypothetical protein
MGGSPRRLLERSAMKVKKLVKGADGRWREEYVSKGSGAAKPNHGGGVYRRGRIFIAVGRA